jgi:hypothetical protein
MDSNLFYELVGYLASLLILVSMTMGNIIRLRIFNLLGAITFTIYGIMINSIPVAATNAIIIGINVYYLFTMINAQSYFKILKVSANNEYLVYFVDFYQDDIIKFQPDIPLNITENSLNIFILRDLVPAGLVSGRITSEGIFTVDIDYVIPRFRDFKTGKFLFQNNIQFFKDEKIKEIRTFAFNRTHIEYLQKIGFSATPIKGEYRLDLKGKN